MSYSHRHIVSDKNKDAAVFFPNDHEWELMNDLFTGLLDLSDVTTYMCSESSVYLSKGIRL